MRTPDGLSEMRVARRARALPSTRGTAPAPRTPALAALIFALALVTITVLRFAEAPEMFTEPVSQPPRFPPRDDEARDVTLEAFARAAAVGAATQCDGQDFTSDMPVGTRFAPPSAVDAVHACGSPNATSSALSAALRNARRAAPLNASLRSERDGVPDGALTLPAADVKSDGGGECALRWLSPATACGVLARVGGVVLCGDSLARQLTQGLALVLSGNFAAGAQLAAGSLPFEQPMADVWKHCTCDAAFGAWHGCHNAPLTEAGVEFRSVCPAWPQQQPAPLAYRAWWSGTWQSGELRALLAARSVAATSAPVLVAEIGPAWDDWTPGNAAIAETLAIAAADARAVGARLVCFLVPAPNDANKPARVMPAQSAASARSVNALVADRCDALGAVVLDGYALTVGAWTRDGTHYEARTNVMLAMALLNLISFDESF